MDASFLSFPSEKPIAICADHAGFDTKAYLIRIFEERGIPYKDFGTYSAESVDYADVAHPLAKAVESGECYPGIAICGSGNGINMTVNKHQGIRSALCWNVEIATLARQHNDANVIAIPGRFVSYEQAYQMVVAFMTTAFEGGRHQRRIEKISC